MTLNDLSKRRREVAVLVGLNYTCQQIATELEMSVRTVHSHLQWIAAKIHTDDDLPAFRKIRGWVNSKASKAA